MYSKSPPARALAFRRIRVVVAGVGAEACSWTGIESFTSVAEGTPRDTGPRDNWSITAWQLAPDNDRAFFNARPKAMFRLTSAFRGEVAMAGISHVPEHMHCVRIARRIVGNRGRVIVVMVPETDIQALNRASAFTLEKMWRDATTRGRANFLRGDPRIVDETHGPAGRLSRWISANDREAA